MFIRYVLGRSHRELSNNASRVSTTLDDGDPNPRLSELGNCPSGAEHMEPFVAKLQLGSHFLLATRYHTPAERKNNVLIAVSCDIFGSGSAFIFI